MPLLSRVSSFWRNLVNRKRVERDLDDEMRALFTGVPDPAWSRGGVHGDSRGRRTLDEFLTTIAWHDDNHLDQLGRALDGSP